MPVKPLRRLTAAVGESLQDRITATTLHNTYFTADVDAIERDHPGLVITDGPNIVAAVPIIEPRIIYGFENDRAFVDGFPAMLERLLPRIRKTLGAPQVRLCWSYAPARPRVDPAIKRLSFTPVRDWLEFRIDRKTKLPPAPAPAGVRFREGTTADLDDLARIDREAFPDSPLSSDALRQRIDATSAQALVATAGRQIAGFALAAAPDADLGWISVLAVNAEHRGRGIGTALTTRMVKKLFAGGVREVGLTTDEGNLAIRLYVRLGFRQTIGGRDYVRLTDPKAIEAQRVANEGTVIRFGGWR